MRQFSAKRAAEQRARVEMLKRHHGPVRCHFPGGCVNEAVDAHEVLTRGRGGSISDPDNVLPLCRGHHDWIGYHPTEALAMGLLASGFPVSDTTATVGGVSDTTKHAPKVALRLSEEGVAFVEKLAADHHRTKSEVYRALFSVASRHVDEVVERLRSAALAPTEPTRKEPTP